MRRSLTAVLRIDYDSVTMKLRLDRITQPLKLSISGNEEWLKPIYDSFEVPKDQVGGLISGSLTVYPESNEIFKITGDLSYTPWVDCSRCGDSIRWQTSGSFSYRIIPVEMDTVEDATGERSFSYPDAEILTHVDGMLDLAEFVNDQIQLAIPLQTINRSADGRDCLDCGKSLQDVQVLRDAESEATQSGKFDVLKKLKF
jgi:uncharacterized metal-binding protein YceD (DUF177 family)